MPTANDSVVRYNQQGSVIHQHFEHKDMPGYILFANDTVDIIEGTLSGKGTHNAY